MKRNAAKPRRKTAAPPRQHVRVQRLSADPASTDPSKRKRPARSASMQLATEVERLVAELERSRAQIVDLEAKVDIDPLTDLLNRRGFERELKRSVAYVKRYGVGAALIFLDLDGFKPVNDRHGHAAGDAVLKAVAAAIVGNVRASDVVARIGGDEFAVLLWNLGATAAAAKAAALERAVYATPVRWGASTLVVGASAGVALAAALDTPDELLARADAAMYARKYARKAGCDDQASPTARSTENITQ
jgi:diguanylate cyclase (GGDEF)-like protein